VFVDFLKRVINWFELHCDVNLRMQVRIYAYDRYVT